MHKKTHNTQPSKPPAMAEASDTFEMDAGDTAPGDMAVGVLQEKVPALLWTTMEAPTQPTPKRAGMNQEIEEMRESIRKLRADLSATNAVLLSVFESIPSVYQEKAMTLLADRVVRQELVAEQLQDPTMQVAAERIEAATQRLWRELEQAIRRSA